MWNEKQIQRDAEQAIDLYAAKLDGVSREECEVLLPFAQEVFRVDVARGEYLQSKANWTLAAGLGMLGYLSHLATGAKPELFGSSATAWLALLPAMVLALFAAMLSLLSKLAAGNFATPTPDAVLQPGIIRAAGGGVHIARMIVLHYFHLFEFNYRCTNNRGRLLILGQGLLFLSILALVLTLAVATFLVSRS